MIIGVAEDLTTNVSLDSELTSVPTSGIYLNSGVHPSITVDNLLYFLPDLTVTFTAWAIGGTYGIYSDSRKRSDIVLYNGDIYQSISSANTGNQPDTSPNEWLLTNYESLRIKTFLYSVQDTVYNDLRLTKRLVNNQYIYETNELGESTVTLPNDYAAWVFEPKGSDYIKFRINQISFKKSGTTPVDLYVVNQGSLITTLSATPNNGKISFTDLGYEFSGFGTWSFVIDSTDVITSNGYIDPLKYDGFIAYTTTGTGITPEGADYSYTASSNGLGFNISAELDSSVYIDNNLANFASYIRAVFTWRTFQMYAHNANNRTNRSQRIQMDDNLLIAEIRELNADSAVSRYHKEKELAKEQLSKSFDTQLFDDDSDIEITLTSV
jgi:hypothetical protein